MAISFGLGEGQRGCATSRNDAWRKSGRALEGHSPSKESKLGGVNGLESSPGRTPVQTTASERRKKQRAIESLEARSPAQEQLLGEVIAIAEDKSEFFDLRRVALRHIHLRMPLTPEKSNILVRLTADASLGP